MSLQQQQPAFKTLFSSSRDNVGTTQFLISVVPSAVKRSIGFTIGFHNHGEGPYYSWRFHI